MDVANTNLPIIKGTFSYINDDKTQSIPIVEKDVSLANLTPELVKSILLTSTELAVNEPVKKPTIDQEVKESVKPVVSNVSKNKQTEVKKEPDTINKKGLEYVKQTTKPVIAAKVPFIETSTQLEPTNGIYFRVQLAAGHRPVNVKRYFHKYKLDNTIYKENHEGWIKYSVGTFNVYKDARDYRVHIWKTTTIADAFVAAYNEGKRITVQEALMVSSQRWYQ
jgi:hypothetical protein